MVLFAHICYFRVGAAVSRMLVLGHIGIERGNGRAGYPPTLGPQLLADGDVFSEEELAQLRGFPGAGRGDLIRPNGQGI